jgi:hypothetical protein
MFSIIQFTEGMSSFFFSTGAQCVAGIAGLSSALAIFHYQNLMQRIREKTQYLYDKYDPLGAGLKKEWTEKYARCHTMEESIDFWEQYFAREGNTHQLMEFQDLTQLIRQTRRFRRAVIRNTFYGSVIMLPLGIAGTLEPGVVLLQRIGHAGPHLIYLALLVLYFLMNVDLTRAAFVQPWSK